jgi:glycosyltransferase involved in cell wall biosynthesis
MPTVTVCLAAYNGERHIEPQLRSILESPLVQEVIVSDDGSTDGTRNVVSSIEDNRLHLLDGPRRGLVRNFEFLLGRATGDLILLSDQDDVWLPPKVERMLAALEQVDLAVCDCRVVDDDLDELHASFFELRGSGPGLWHNLMRNGFLGCCLGLRRELLLHALPFPEGVPMHDWWLGLVAESFGRTSFVPEVLTLYRRHGANVSSTAEASRVGWITRIQWRAMMVRALAARRLGKRHHRTSEPRP